MSIITKVIGELTPVVRFNAATSPEDAKAIKPSLEIPIRYGGKSVSVKDAFGVTAVYNAIDKISSSIASVDFSVVNKQRDRVDIDYTHDQHVLLQTNPCPFMSAFDFKKMLMVHALGWGNGFAKAVRNANGRPVEYQLIHPSRFLEAKVIEDRIVVYFTGENPIYYEDLVHVKAMSDEGFLARSPIRVHVETIAAALERSKYSSRVMSQGAHFGAVIEHPDWFDAATRSQAKTALSEYMGAINSGKIPILEGGMKLQSVALNPLDAQIAEQMKFGVYDVARIYNMPAVKIGGMEGAIQANVEQLSIEYVTDCLQPWAIRVSQAFDRVAFRTAERGNKCVRIDVHSLVLADMKSKTEHLEKMLRAGVYDHNEARATLGMNPVEEGGRRMVGMNQIPLDRVDDYVEALLAKVANKIQGEQNSKT